MSDTKETAIVKAVESAVTVQPPDIHNLRALASDLLNSGLFQGVKNIAGAVTVIQAGLELGIPPVAALNTMVVINGRLAMEAKALLAVAQKRAGVTWRVVREDDKGCEILFSRPGWPDTSSTFTEEEAKVAGLLGKTNWKLWAKDMYFARAAGRGIRRIAPDAVLGLYTKEEMTDAPVNLNSPVIPTVEIKAEDHPAGEPLPRVKDEFTETEPEGQPLVGGASLEQLAEMAKRIAAIRSLGEDEDKIYKSMAKRVREKYHVEFAELGELSPEIADACITYLNRWEKAKRAEIAEGAK